MDQNTDPAAAVAGLQLLLQGPQSSPCSPCMLSGSSPLGAQPLASPQARLGSCGAASPGARPSSVERRLSATAVPGSHPVEGASGSSSSSPVKQQPAGSPLPTLQPAATAAAAEPAAAAGEPAVPVLPAEAAAAAEEPRIALTLLITDAAGSSGEEAQQLQAELAGLQASMGLLQQQLLEQTAAAETAAAEAAAAAQAAAEAAAAAEQQEQARVELSIAVVDAPAAAAEAAASHAPRQEEQPVQLVLNIIEPSPAAEPASGGDGAAPAAAAAALQQQLQRAEACREELARQAGQLKGRIAKLEGAVLAGEGRVKGQAAELEEGRAQLQRLEQELAAAQAQVGVTPEHARAEQHRLAEALVEAEAAAAERGARVQRLEAVLAFEARERAELGEFTAQEHQLLMEQEHSLTAEAAQWQADATAAAAQLGDARQRLVAADGALQQRDEEAGQLRGELEAAQAAAAAAAGVTAEWRQRAEQYDKDRQAAASNIRKAEHELSLVAADNERMFRQLNFVRTRLMGQLPGLDGAVPDIGKLARELQSWCDREVAQRGRQLKA